MIKEDWQVIDLRCADVHMIAGSNVQASPEGHGKRCLVSVRAGEIVVQKVSVISRHPEEGMRERNDRRRVAPIESRASQKQITAKTCVESATAQTINQLGIGKGG